MDWQLGNWIRSSQQNSHAEGHCDARASDSLKPPSSQSAMEVVEPSWESKPQHGFNEGGWKAPARSQGRPHHSTQPGSPTPPPAAGGPTACGHKHSHSRASRWANAGCVPPPAGVKCEKVVATLGREPCFTVRPKVKTKMGPDRKHQDRCEAKKTNKRTCKQASHSKRKAGSQSEVALVLYGHCPSCGVQYPNSCSCPTHSPAPPDQASPAAPIRISCTKSKSDSIFQKGAKVPQKNVRKRRDKAPRSSRDSRGIPRSLLVKIDLSLLSKVPQTSGGRRESLCKTKRSSAVKQQERRSSGAHTAQKMGKSSKKSQNVR